MQKIETNIAALTKRGEQLAAKRVTARDTLDEAIKARQKALLAGDLDDQRKLDKLQDAVDSAMSALAGIDDALAVLTQQKAEAAKQLTAERERIERTKASEEISAAVMDIEARIDPMLSGMRDLGNALTAIDHLSFEVGQLGRYLSNVSGEVEVALAFVVPDLRRLADAVKNGSVAIPRRPKAAEPVPMPEPPPPTMTVFMRRSAHYRDQDGRKRFAGQWEDAIMPVATAQRALDKKIAVAVTDPCRAQLRGTRGGDFNPEASDVVDLDAVEEAKDVPRIEPDPVLRAANFTVIDRSAEARTVEIAVSRV
jgi:hypothetical protein